MCCGKAKPPLCSPRLRLSFDRRVCGHKTCGRTCTRSTPTLAARCAPCQGCVVTRPVWHGTGLNARTAVSAVISAVTGVWWARNRWGSVVDGTYSGTVGNVCSRGSTPPPIAHERQEQTAHQIPRGQPGGPKAFDSTTPSGDDDARLRLPSAPHRPHGTLRLDLLLAYCSEDMQPSNTGTISCWRLGLPAKSVTAAGAGLARDRFFTPEHERNFFWGK